MKFAENWKVKKFIYATSIGRDIWSFKSEEEKIAKKLIKNFSGISFREKGLVKLAKEHLGIKGILVLDPTLLIDKQYYLNEIKNYKNSLNKQEKFIKDSLLEKTVLDSSEKFNYKINKFDLNKKDYIESFIFGINNSQAVITDSFHGTIFSIIFNKPFISFMNTKVGRDRFNSLIEIFNLKKRIINSLKNDSVNINVLLEPLNLNQTLLNELRIFSINYIKKNLDLL